MVNLASVPIVSRRAFAARAAMPSKGAPTRQLAPMGRRPSHRLPGWAGNLGCPPYSWDLYLTDLHPMRWLTSELARIVKHRIDNSRPAILDGMCALDVVDQIKRKAGSSLAPQIAAYRSRQRFNELADFTLEGCVE
jgi:hypothetical protein